jgi:hypothetical protein
MTDKQAACIRKIIDKAAMHEKHITENEAIALINDAYFNGVFSHLVPPPDIEDKTIDSIVEEWLGG